MIGTTTAGGLLNINGTSSNALLSIYTSSTVSSLYLTSIGNVLVGTTTAATSNVLFSVATTSNIFTVLNTNNVLVGTTTAATANALFSVATTSNNLFTVFNTGRIGIGTTTPAYAMVLGNGTGTQSDFYIASGALCVNNKNTGCPTSPVAGTIYAVSTSISGIDVAENYPTIDSGIEAGDVVAADTSNPQFIVKATSSYEANLLGVISTAPGMLLGWNEPSDVVRPVALAGRVPVKVTAKNGAIAIGDYLTASDIPGVAMKATAPGRVIGTALEDYNPTSTDEISKIVVFVNAEWTMGSLVREEDIIADQNSPVNASLKANGLLDQFTLFVGNSINNLGAVLKDGVMSLKQLIADKITTKELCVEDVCLTKDQLKNLLDRNGISQPSSGSGSPAVQNDVSTPPADSGGQASTSTDVSSDISSPPSEPVDNSNNTSDSSQAPTDETITP